MLLQCEPHSSYQFPHRCSCLTMCTESLPVSVSHGFGHAPLGDQQVLSLSRPPTDRCLYTFIAQEQIGMHHLLSIWEIHLVTMQSHKNYLQLHVSLIQNKCTKLMNETFKTKKHDGFNETTVCLSGRVQIRLPAEGLDPTTTRGEL